MKPKARAIDWETIKHRLAESERRIDEERTPPPARRQAILEARAAALAEVPAPPPGAGFEALAFTLAREHYLLETRWVREVYPLRDFTALPGTPAFVLGIVHLRGRILSVLDLKKFFDLPTVGLSDLNKVIVLANETMEFGILADSIVGVGRVAHADLQPALPTLTELRADYLLGITGRREVVLDAGKLLSDPAIVIAKQVDQ